MKQLLYLVMSLVIIAAIIPAASAYEFHSGTWSTSLSYYGHPVTYLARTPLDSETWWMSGQAGMLQLAMVNNTGPARLSIIKMRVLNPASPWLVQGWNGTAYHPIGVIGLHPNGDPRINIAAMDEIILYYRGSQKFSNIGFFSNSSVSTVAVAWVEMWWEEAEDEPNFSGSPLTGSAPLAVGFTATNTTTPTNLSWSFGDGTVEASTSTTINHTYQSPGIYTVRMDYTNLSGTSKSVQKNNYITVGAPNATATTHAVARDLYTGFAINGAQVDMYDVENISWTNTTAINGEGSITMLLGHTINIWGSATGYEDDNLQGVPAVDGGYYSLLLRPTNLTTYNSTPGNLTLAVTVQDLQIPHQTLSGAEVTAAWGAQYASGTSNAAGSVFFTVPNNTAIHLSAFKSGYASGSSTHITGTANGGSTMETTIVYIGTDYVTPVPSVTATTGPGGTVPQTVDPYPCIGDGSPEDTANCQRKQGSMAADLISYGPDLVRFFIMLTFIGGLMLLLKRR